MIRICSSLSRAGFEVHIIGFKKKYSSEIPPRTYRQTRLNLLFQKGKLFYVEVCIRLFFKLLFTKADYICAIDMDTLLPARLAAIFKLSGVVFDAHEYFSETSGLVGRRLEKGVWQGMERLLIPGIKYAYTVNTSLAGIFKEKFSTEFSVIMNTPELKDEKPGTGKEHYYLYQGALNKGRGLEELIEIFSTNTLNLKIAGSGPLESSLKEMLKSRKMGERVELLGFIPPNELNELTSNAFAGFNLIDGRGMSYYYSLANKFFDYMHAGVPQICMNFPEYQRINDRHRIAILIESFDQIKESIEELEAKPDLYETLSQNALKARYEYNWEREEKKLIEFYKALS